MQIKKRDALPIFAIFLSIHALVWTLVPTAVNTNLPLDVIEALAWGNNLDWGFNKHPPASAFFVEVFYQIFGRQDWAYYFLSQIFVISSFFVVWKFSEDFFQNQSLRLMSVVLLEGIYFYNFTTPEFNVNVCQLPFWSLAVLFCWRGIKNNKITDWLLFGLFAAFGVLSKYLFIYLLAALDIFFIYLIVKKKFNYKCFVSLISFFIVLIPHFIWLTENDYITINYAFHRTGIEDGDIFNHFIYPLTFLLKQIGILLPFFLMLLFTVSKFKNKINLKDQKLLFLIIINLVPIILMFLTSLITGAKIRSMWMTPFYLFSGVFFIYIFQNKINLKKIKYFFSIFLFLFILSPSAYLYISISNENKRTDYPGKEISRLVQERWENNFKNEIMVVIGDEWYGGNLSYHLNSRPKWYNEMSEELKNKKLSGGVIYTGNADILKTICPGIFGKIKSQGICMIGSK